MVITVDRGEGDPSIATLPLLVRSGQVDRARNRTDPLGTGGSGAFAGDTARGCAAPAHPATTARSALTVPQPHVGGGRT